jgi:putative membrane protein
MPTQPQDGADRRAQLAADRTLFAAERTYAAWVRTGLAALASGVGAKKLLEGVIPRVGLWAVGTVLVLFSAFCFGAAIWRQVFPGPAPPQPDTPRIPPALLVVVNGFLMLVALSALIRTSGSGAGAATSALGPRLRPNDGPVIPSRPSRPAGVPADCS